MFLITLTPESRELTAVLSEDAMNGMETPNYLRRSIVTTKGPADSHDRA
jgi:hypothetical protein